MVQPANSLSKNRNGESAIVKVFKISEAEQRWQQVEYAIVDE